ncbi:MAG: stage V sporulation protein AA [Eubacteriales bacterium]|nr:stage V sporulation protein AA [Eubacteriales bacterium]
MQKETLYLKLDKSAAVSAREARLEDLARLYCRDEPLLAKIRRLRVFAFRDRDGGRRVVSALYIIRLLQRQYPGLEVESIGETQVVAELLPKEPESVRKAVWRTAKLCFVCGICFFGAAFTIMAFHNDVGISEVFAQIYGLVSGKKAEGVTVLEISYSIGLALGITVFFNHIGGRRITRDPTPIEVEMRNYEDAVNNALAETADRENETLDVE